jgi:hypothetical protein
MTDSPNYDTAKILFPNLPPAWFVDADSSDMYYALQIGVKHKAVGDKPILSNRLRYEVDHGKLDTIYTNEVSDFSRKKESEEYYKLAPPAKEWQEKLLNLSPFFPTCEKLVREGALKMSAYKMLEGIIGAWPSEAFDKKVVETLQVVSSVAGEGSPHFRGAKRMLEGYIERLDKAIEEMGGLGGKIEVKTYSDRTLQKEKASIQKEFFREGKNKDEWKSVHERSYALWSLLPDGDDRELTKAICNDSWSEYQKLLPQERRQKRSLVLDIMEQG